VGIPGEAVKKERKEVEEAKEEKEGGHDLGEG
jgi:hypothetical protein